MTVTHRHFSTSWVIKQQSIDAVFAIINVYIVSKEIHKRHHDNPKFKSFSLKWLSLLSIAGGLLFSLCSAMKYFDFLCFFMPGITITLLNIVPLVVGLYQLSRLYQCFADKKTPGGYPKWVFCAMTTFAILYLLGSIVDVVSNNRYLNCGLLENYEYYYSVDAAWSDRTRTVFIYITAVVYSIWDITTLLLFISKMRPLTQSTTTTHCEHLVLGIRVRMTRIIILTIFYNIMQTLSQLVSYSKFFQDLNYGLPFLVDQVEGSLLMTSMSYAVFLMQPHNSREYALFLNRVICLKLHFCCCCYCDAVVAQRDYFQVERPLIVPRAETGTAFNNFSLDYPPSDTYQAPDIPPIVPSNQVLQIVMGEDQEALRSESVVGIPVSPEDESDNSAHEGSEPLSETGIRIPFNDFLFEVESKAEDGFVREFSFGVYLEYWRPNRRNSVTPRYRTLKDELTRNRVAPISKEQYEWLVKECSKSMRSVFLAADIGIMNKICGIKVADMMTLDHVICIKLYANFTELQRKFKRHCRRIYRDEPIDSVIRRNSEIAHWCRHLKEAIMFWGETMGENETVYCGLNVPLIFNSLHQRFECPLSTTKQITVADQFSKSNEAGEHGVILKLKRANPKSRYLNVAEFTQYTNEDERLFMGSTLKIVDIIYKNTSLKQSISALMLFEHILRGQFLQSTKKTRKLLLRLLRRVIQPFARDNDAILNDVESADRSSIIRFVTDGLFVDIPKYIELLFLRFLKEMMVLHQRGSLWLNHRELEKKQYLQIKEALHGDGKLFDLWGINKEDIPSVRPYQWTIEGYEYQELRNLVVSEYAFSPSFVYPLSSDDLISIRLRCYGQYIEDSPKCAIFIEIEDFPESVEKLRIEADIKCTLYRGGVHGKKKKSMEHKQLLKTQILSRSSSVCGFQLFDHEELIDNESLEWMVGVKILRADHFVYDEHEEYLKDLYQILA